MGRGRTEGTPPTDLDPVFIERAALPGPTAECVPAADARGRGALPAWTMHLIYGLSSALGGSCAGVCRARERHEKGLP